LILNPIRKVLSSIASHQVRALLMGGQACILYGAAEFSRDADFAILASEANLAQLRAALDDLQAETIAVPPFLPQFLARGHAVHFRCKTPDAAGLRVDIMTKMRGVDEFPQLWERRFTWSSDDGTVYEVMSLPDLVKAKKTQRDKDWPMIRRLVEADYFNNIGDPSMSQVRFWLSELRTPELLINLAAMHPAASEEMLTTRSLLKFADAGDERALVAALGEEEAAEREADREYWKPLKAELERLRRELRAKR
jgi:hypothetical protein